MTLNTDEKLMVIMFIEQRLPVTIFDLVMREDYDIHSGDTININYKISSNEWYAAVNMPMQIVGQPQAKAFQEKLRELKEIYDEYKSEVARL